MLLHEITTSGQSVERAARRIRGDGLEHISLYLNTLAVRGVSGEQTIEAPAGSVIVSTLSRPLRRQHVRDAGAIVISLTRDRLAEVLPDPEAYHGTVLSGGMGRILRDHMRSLAGEARDTPRDAAAGLSRSTALMLAAALEPERQRLGDARHSLDGVALFRARRFIENSVRMPGLTPDMVAAAVGVSQRTLYRLFAPAGGVASFIRQHRLQAARAALLSSGGRARIAEIAYAHGFGDPAQFSRSIRKAYGLSPRELMEEAASIGGIERGKAGGSYQLWVKALG